MIRQLASGRQRTPREDGASFQSTYRDLHPSSRGHTSRHSCLEPFSSPASLTRNSVDFKSCITSLRLNANYECWVYWEVPVDCEDYAAPLIAEAEKLGLAADWDAERSILRVRRPGVLQVHKRTARARMSGT